MDAKSSTGLDVVIIGAGLVGLLTARVLREQHNVTVYERSRGANEVGAAVGLSPSVTKIVRDVGCDQARVRSLPVALNQLYDRNGRLVHETDMIEAREKLGIKGDYLLSHRRDLHAEFYRLATSPSSDMGIQGVPAKIVYGKEVVTVEPDRGSITFKDGETINADLIIGADGIKSAVRPCIVGDAAFTTARPSGMSAFRFLLSRDKLIEAFGTVPRPLQKDMPVTLTKVDSGDGTRRAFVMYPCRDFELLNALCIVRDSALENPSFESWTATGDKDELQRLFQDFPDWVQTYLRLVEEPKLWQLRDQDPLPTYVRGRTIIIGDAAHPMTPHQGAGASQGVEDAEAFCLFLSSSATKAITRDQVPDILKDIDSVRRVRASRVQDNTRASARNGGEDIHRHDKFNWTYDGIVEGLKERHNGESAVTV